MFAGQSIAWSQCIVYNATFKGSSSGTYSSSYTSKGYTILGPLQIMQDGLTRYQSAAFELSSGKGYKDFYYDIKTPVNGTPSSGGLLTGFVKQGKTLKVLVTSDATFNSDTTSGIATLKNVPGIGNTYIATTLAGTYSEWLLDSKETRPIGDSNSFVYNRLGNPVNVYKHTASDTYTYNPSLTANIAGKNFDEAVAWAKQTLEGQGYTDRVANPYPQ